MWKQPEKTLRNLTVRPRQKAARPPPSVLFAILILRPTPCALLRREISGTAGRCENALVLQLTLAKAWLIIGVVDRIRSFQLRHVNPRDPRPIGVAKALRHRNRGDRSEREETDERQSQKGPA